MNPNEIIAGQKYVVQAFPRFAFGTPSEVRAGDVVTAVTGGDDGKVIDSDGDARLMTEDGVMAWVAPKSLVPLDEEEEEEPAPIRASVGSATLQVRAEVRFYVGDLDVTDRIKGLLA